MKKSEAFVIYSSFIGLFLTGIFIFCCRHIILTWFATKFLAITFIITCFLWLVAELFDTYYGNKNNSESVSFSLLIASEVILLLGIVFALFVCWDLKEDNYYIKYGLIQYCGIFIMIFGILFRQFVIIKLNKRFSTIVHPNKNLSLLTSGAYKYIRHPSYTGSLLTLIGLPLALGSFLGFILVSIITVMAYSLRIKHEEASLIKAYGQKYKEYQEKTWKLFPGF